MNNEIYKIEAQISAIKKTILNCKAKNIFAANNKIKKLEKEKQILIEADVLEKKKFEEEIDDYYDNRFRDAININDDSEVDVNYGNNY